VCVHLIGHFAIEQGGAAVELFDGIDSVDFVAAGGTAERGAGEAGQEAAGVDRGKA